MSHDAAEGSRHGRVEGFSRIVDSKASKRSLAEHVDMVSADLNAMEIGSVLLLERNREIQSGIESRVAVAVFALPSVKDCKSCLDLKARKVNRKLRDATFWRANPGAAETCKVSMAVSETNDMSHDVFFPCCDEGTEVCVCHEGRRSKLELRAERSLRVASRDRRAHCSDDWREREVGFDLVTFAAGADRGHDDHDCKFRVHEVLEARKTSELCRRSAGKVSRHW